jgi:hypothetical protein
MSEFLARRFYRETLLITDTPVQLCVFERTTYEAQRLVGPVIWIASGIKIIRWDLC